MLPKPAAPRPSRAHVKQLKEGLEPAEPQTKPPSCKSPWGVPPGSRKLNAFSQKMAAGVFSRKIGAPSGARRPVL